MKDVAVVILNWNGVDFLRQFLGQVVDYSGCARVIVADNASSDESISFLKNNFPQVQIIQHDQNGGFAKGYNDALKQIDSKYYLLLNSDVEVTPNWLEPLVASMEDKSIIGCQPKVRAHHNKELFEHAGAAGGFIDKNYFPFCRGRIFNEVEKDNGQHDDPMEIFWVTGAAMMIRSEVFHQCGGFDEDFFAHMEEIDLCWRIKKRGGKFIVVPDSTVYHVGGGALSYSSPRKTYLNFRNNLVMILKNHEGLWFPKMFWRMSLDGIAAAKFLFSAQFANFWAVFKSHMYIYFHLGTILKKRKAVKKSSTSFNAKGLYQGNIIWNFYGKGVKNFSDLNQRLFK